VVALEGKPKVLLKLVQSKKGSLNPFLLAFDEPKQLCFQAK
jgi:hypothetical protein